MSQVILISTEQGRAAIRIDGNWYPIDLTGHSPSVIRCVWEDGPDNFWFGGVDGLAHVNNSGIVEFGIANNLPRRPISNAYRDSNGTFWVASWGDAIASMVGNGFARIDQAMGLCHSDVNGIAEDARGRLWIGTDKVFRFTRGGRSCLVRSSISFAMQTSSRSFTIANIGSTWARWVLRGSRTPMVT